MEAGVGDRGDFFCKRQAYSVAGARSFTRARGQGMGPPAGPRQWRASQAGPGRALLPGSGCTTPPSGPCASAVAATPGPGPGRRAAPEGLAGQCEGIQSSKIERLVKSKIVVFADCRGARSPESPRRRGVP